MEESIEEINGDGKNKNNYKVAFKKTPLATRHSNVKTIGKDKRHDADTNLKSWDHPVAIRQSRGQEK